MPSEVERAIIRLRRELSVAESAQRGRMVAAYQRAIAQTEAQLWAFLKEMEAFPNGGATYRQIRLEQLLDSVEREFESFVRQAEPLIRDAQQIAVKRGIDSAQQIVTRMAPQGGFSGTLNRPAFERAVSAFGEGSPLRAVLETHGTNAARVIEQGIVDGIATGQGATTVMRTIEDQLEAGINRARLEATVRTEMMRAYRGAQIDAFRDVAGQDIIGWRWVAHKSARTCMACIAMSRTLYPVDSPPSKQHVSCRCTIRPEMDPEIIGGPSDIETAADWFDRQDPAVQRDMIGNDDVFDAFQRGSLRLPDFAKTVSNPVWGDSVQVQTQAGLKESMRTWDPPVVEKRRGKVEPAVGQGEQHFGMEYVSTHERSRMPDDMQEIVGANHRVLTIDHHVFDQMVPGADHSESMWYVENMDMVLERWAERWAERSPSPNPTTPPRWEFYTPAGKDFEGNDLWYLVVVEEGHTGASPKVVSSYPIKDSTVSNRRKSKRRNMKKRGEK